MSRIVAYVPRGTWWKDSILHLIGEPNAWKQLQLSGIFRALDLKQNEIALDIGCGSGYMTYAMARLCRKAYGIDIQDVESNAVPRGLKGRIEFVKGQAEQTPFASGMFDVVLLSEIVPFIPDQLSLFREVARILKPDGRIVLVNPLDRQTVRRDFEQNSWAVRLAHRLGSVPESYQEYTEQLQRSFGPALKELPDKRLYEDLLERIQYEVDECTFTPSASAQGMLERLQLVAFARRWPTCGSRFYLVYPLLKLVDVFSRTAAGTGCVMVARRRKELSRRAA